MIKVFIIDDSMLVRNSITSILRNHAKIKVIGEAPNPIDAFEIFKRVGLPDVFILDIEMPKMDGLTFFKQINQQKPIPVIICSTLVSKGSDAAIDSLRLGAVEIIHKPKIQLKDFFLEQKDEIINAVIAASLSKVIYKNEILSTKEISKKSTPQIPSSEFIVIGSSTGGVQVIEEIISKLNNDHVGIVITQHMPEGFTASFSQRLNKLTHSQVIESKDDELIANNKIIIAKGGIHTEIIQKNNSFYTQLKDYPKVNSHKPSVNVLFKSVSKLNLNSGTAFILTGMGNDGASGIKRLKDQGFNTYGQKEDSCVVYGMPKAAFEIGGISEELNIDEIISTINNIKG